MAAAAAEPSRLKGVVDALVGEALKDVLQNLRDHTELQRRIVRGELDRGEVNRAYVDYARRRGGEYRRRVGELSAAYYADLAELGKQYSGDFYEEVLANGGAAPAPAAADGEEVTRASIELHGEPGREVVARFDLENTDPEPVEAVFDVGLCRGPDGEEFTAPLSIHPARLLVAPGDRAEVVIRVAMLPSVFEPGRIYRSTVRVVGYRELELDVVIWAEEPMVVFPGDETVPGAAPGPATDATGEEFAVVCACGRRFRRQAPTTRLYPHKRPDGTPCPERSGEVVVG